MIAVRTHEVARKAYERVAARRDGPDKTKYGALAHRLPGLILENGLAQATGFLLAKGKGEHRALLDDLAAVLRVAGATNAGDGQELHESIIGADLHPTLHLTRHALEASGWLKRYVQGVLRVGATGEDDEKSGEEDGEEAAS